MTSLLSNVSARSAAFALYQLDLPAVNPDSIARCVKSIISDKSDLCNLLETDPAAAIVFIDLCRQNNIELAFDTLNFRQSVSKVPTQKLLKTFLSLKTFDLENQHTQLPIAEMNGFSAARAFAARLIAAKTGQAPEKLSFFAGLFADIGLLAIAELYPKSLVMMLEESRGDNSALLRLEKENLGITHNVLSRRLAHKWLLPTAIADSAWLYCTDAADGADNIPGIEIIQTVRLADMLVKSITSGGESPAIPAKVSITVQDVNEITDKLKSFIAEMNVKAAEPQKFDTETAKQVCMPLLENSWERKFSDFLSAMSASLNPASSAIDAAGTICRLICRILNAEKACIYLLPQDYKQYETATAAGDTLQFSTVANPSSASDMGFDPQNTEHTKLQIGKYTIGEMFLQIKNAGSLPEVSVIASFVSQLIAVKLAGEHDQSIAQAVIDNFAQTPKEQPPQLSQPAADVRETIAEIAAGAAHELNNPLAVISGRAQLLMESETDETKKLIMRQIVEKTGDAYEMVGQLMSYARPAKPQIRTVSPFIMVNNCLEKANARYLSEPIDVTVENIENLSDIEVDPEQIAEAIAQIIYNALESYESGNGPVRIIGSEQPQSDTIEIVIKDQGCGMSEETLRKAAEPFFSDKAAGRQRGMGLALASSLLKNNGCTISIQSQPDKGTTVTILLPKTNKSE
ncbi:MAG: ATP-binding protein [Phycisphaerae bacterium]|jgi:signal transduction histidine kinase